MFKITDLRGGGCVELTDEQRELCESNYGLIYSFLAKKCYRSYNFDEIEFHAVNGYLKAVMTFDKKNTRFSTYAYTCMFNEVAMLGRKENTKNKYETPRDHVSKEILEVKTEENALDQMIESYNERLKAKILKEVRRTILKYNVNNNRGKKFKYLIERYDLNVTPTEFARIKGTSQANIWQLEKSAIKVLRDDAYLKQLYEHYKKCID